MRYLLCLIFLAAQAGQIYDPTTVEKFEGHVTMVDDSGPGIHLTLETEKGTYSVKLGPSWYVLEQPMKISVGDEIIVTGSRIGTTIIAAQIRKDDQVMILRTLNGVPNWAGQRQ